jgi:CRP-like cAMP-binding protein
VKIGESDMDSLDAGEIPPNELAIFDKFLQTYRSGGQIITEGKTDDNSLYLLRIGTVGIYRLVDDEQKLLASIDAVNFFGEMALIVGGPRTATVKAISDEVIVYKFQSPDLKTIFANPTWGDMLIKRLCVNLKQSNDQIIGLEGDNSKLRHTYERLKAQYENTLQQSALIFTALNELQSKIAEHAVMTSREWHYLISLHELVQRFLKAKLPDVYIRLHSRGAAAIEALQAEDLLPDKLQGLL